MEPQNPSDPRGLIRESFRIDGITQSECRTIFLDWAISMPDGVSTVTHVQSLLDSYRDQNLGHPMIGVLEAALNAPAQPKRRGGARGRRSG